METSPVLKNAVDEQRAGAEHLMALARAREALLAEKRNLMTMLTGFVKR